LFAKNLYGFGLKLVVYVEDRRGYMLNGKCLPRAIKRGVPGVAHPYEEELCL